MGASVYLPFTGLVGLAVIFAYVAYTETIWSRSLRTRQAILERLGFERAASTKYKFVGFFHPYCNAGGGGERVLWTAIAHIQREHKDIISVIYSGDTDATKQEIIEKVKARFAIELDPSTLYFVYLKSRHVVEDSRWPRFTILGQSLGSMYLAWEAMCKFIPDLYIDTMGYAFTYPAISWLTRAAVPIGAYVHYPIISTDMIGRVRNDESWRMQAKRIGSNSYYRLTMYYYALSLSHARFLMVNSSWTRDHIASIITHEHVGPAVRWMHRVTPLLIIKLALSSSIIRNFMLVLDGYSAKGIGSDQTVRPEIVYPPCDTREMGGFDLDDREPIILSVAQFRREKNHQAQLRAFAQLLMDHPEYKATSTTTSKNVVRLVLLGGARNENDLDRVESLRTLASELAVEDQVSFLVNVSYSDVLKWLSRSSIGLSTMVDEHFGINIVEFMSQPTGFHAKTPGEFAAAMHEASIFF
ncbi:hypothetical protein ID866_1713 [Astraeus odoratus]|nr:hypothetical protein ID866_1713 [Astraeus odoratus]